jgi:hypothetical protein
VEAIAAKKAKLEHAKAAAAAASIGATNPLRKHHWQSPSQKPLKKQGGDGDKQGPGGSKQGGGPTRQSRAVKLKNANVAAIAAIGATNPLRKHQSPSQKPLKKQGGDGDKQGPGGSKQGGSG